MRAPPFEGNMVRVAGVEPALLAEPDFESGASTNSTTPACGSCLAETRRRDQMRYAATVAPCMPHSIFDEPAQRPARWSSPGATARVQTEQPIDG